MRSELEILREIAREVVKMFEACDRGEQPILTAELEDACWEWKRLNRQQVKRK